MTNDEARKKFVDAGLSYKKIGVFEISLLILALKRSLKKWNKNNDFKMRLIMVRDGDKSFSSDLKSLNHYFIRVNGNDWKHREAISFNRSGNIGFAGWASTKNSAPIIEAFCEWIDTMKAEGV